MRPASIFSCSTWGFILPRASFQFLLLPESLLFSVHLVLNIKLAVLHPFHPVFSCFSTGMKDLESTLAERGVRISTIPDKGRCLITARDFSPGDTILSQEPYVCAPNESNCQVCFSSSKLRCSVCQVVRYCGVACQKRDWKLHRFECGPLSRLDERRKKSLTPSIRLMVKLCLRRNLEKERLVPVSPAENYYLVDALLSHMSDLDDERLVLYAQMASLVNSIIQLPEMSIREITENFSKLACNAHSVCDSELRALGTGLYPVISIINHSCLPNSVLVFEGRLAIVRAVEHIPNGNEVLISYIETAGSTMTRQKALKEQYFFTCACLRCNRVGQYDYIYGSAVLEGYRCGNDDCHGVLLRECEKFVCLQCGQAREKDAISMMAFIVKARTGEASKYLSSGNHLEAYSMYKDVEKRQRILCHPFSLDLMRTRDALLRILIKLKNWEEALSYCRLTIPVYRRAYQRFHPLLGLQYYTCGKLEWLVGHTEDAVESFSSALDVLRITYGTESQFMKELMLKLEEARAEAFYK